MRNLFNRIEPPDFYAPLQSNLLLMQGRGNGAAYDDGGGRTQAFTAVVNGASRGCLGASLNAANQRIEFAAGNYDRSAGALCFWHVPAYSDAGNRLLLAMKPFNTDPTHRAAILEGDGSVGLIIFDAALNPLYLIYKNTDLIVNVPRFIALAYGAGKMRIGVNGAWSDEQNFAGVDGDCTLLEVGVPADLIGVMDGAEGVISDLMVWKRKIATRELDRIYHATKALHGRAA